MRTLRSQFKTPVLWALALALGFVLSGCGSSPQKSGFEESVRNTVTKSFQERARRQDEKARSERAEEERLRSERERILEMRERQKKTNRIAELLRSIKKGGVK
jgi:hypothetical protein